MAHKWWALQTLATVVDEWGSSWCECALDDDDEVSTKRSTEIGEELTLIVV